MSYAEDGLWLRVTYSQADAMPFQLHPYPPDLQAAEAVTSMDAADGEASIDEARQQAGTLQTTLDAADGEASIDAAPKQAEAEDAPSIAAEAAKKAATVAEALKHAQDTVEAVSAEGDCGMNNARW